MDNAFTICSLCGRREGDICEFRLWQKTDSDDRPIDDYMVACTDAQCRAKIDDDPALFIEVPWGMGGPGRFMLLCGDCPSRAGFRCTHPSLKANGGTGLEVKFSQLLGGAIICGSSGCMRMPTPAVSCAGRPVETEGS